MRTGAFFFAMIVSAVIGLVFGSEPFREIMAGGLLVVAVPLWLSIQRESIAKGIARAAKVVRGRRESS